jgi:hypothetical protein
MGGGRHIMSHKAKRPKRVTANGRSKKFSGGAAMITVLLWVVVCYALAAAAVHTASRLNWKREPQVKHFVLIAENHQMQMEWYIRSLQWYSLRFGKEVRVTVVNQGSEDETMDIARFFARSGMDIRFAGGESGADFETQEKIKGSVSGGSGDLRTREYGQAGSGEMRAPISKWQRFRLGMKRRKAYRRERNIAGTEAHHNGRGNDAEASTHLYWMTKQGIVTDKEHAVLVDLRDPGELTKLPL